MCFNMLVAEQKKGQSGSSGATQGGTTTRKMASDNTRLTTETIFDVVCYNQTT
jgi:hypothetical protein